MTITMVRGSEQDITDYLNDTKIRGPFRTSGLAVGGKTLIFSTPVATVTFTGVVGATRTLAEIIAQVEGAVSGMDVSARTVNSSAGQGIRQLLAFLRDGGFTLSSTGTANALLGFSTTASTVQTPVNSRLISGFSSAPGDNRYALALNNDVVLGDPDGSFWYTGAGVPSSGLGADGDLYLRTSNSDVYQKASGAWAVVTNLAGAQGTSGNLTISSIKVANSPLVAGELTRMNTTGGVLVATLPTAVGIAGQRCAIKRVAGSNDITMASTGGQTIDGFVATTITLDGIFPLSAAEIIFISDGANWLRLQSPANAVSTAAGAVIDNALLRTDGTNGRSFQSGGVTLDDGGKLLFASTITPGGTTGDQTINTVTGTVNIAALGTTVTVTNSQCTVNSTVIPTIRTNDATATIKNCVPGNGSFVITLNSATTAEISIGFLVIN